MIIRIYDAGRTETFHSVSTVEACFGLSVYEEQSFSELSVEMNQTYPLVNQEICSKTN